MIHGIFTFPFFRVECGKIMCLHSFSICKSPVCVVVVFVVVFLVVVVVVIVVVVVVVVCCLFYFVFTNLFLY